MSHFATNWAIQQRGLRPATKIVLWHLCDRHNPDFGCFPTQARLAADCEMSVSSLNDHLRALEDARLIQRIRCHDAQTHRRQATRYVLGFEDRFPDPADDPDDDPAPDQDDSGGNPSPESGHGAISEKTPKPSPDPDHSHLRNPETNPVREPLSKPVKEEEGAPARDDRFEAFFTALLGALGLNPDTGLPGWWQGWPPREHVRRWRDDFGLGEDRIIAVARQSRSTHPEPPDGPRALDRLMERAARSEGVTKSGSDAQPHKRRGKSADAPHADPDEIAGFYAGLVNGDTYLPPGMISNRVRNAMLARGLVTAERLKARGVL